MSFDDEITSAVAEAADVFDFETFQATPMKGQAHGGPVADPDRPAFEFKGQYDVDAMLFAGGSDKTVRPDSQERRSSAMFMITAHVSTWLHNLKNGDRITRDKTDEKFTIATTMPDGAGNVALTLNIAK